MPNSQAAKQRLFDKALKHIRNQGCQSKAGALDCKYKQGNLGCAFAPAIRQYDATMEGEQASDLIRDMPDNLYKWVLDVDLEFADQVQYAHDDYIYIDTLTKEENDARFMECFEKNMKELSIKFHLVYSQPQEAAPL